MTFDILLTCTTEQLQHYAEEVAQNIKAEEVEPFIRTLWKRVPELSVEQEKKLHQLGRKTLKRFHMSRIKD